MRISMSLLSIVLSIIVLFTSCNAQDNAPYEPSVYTKDEVLHLFDENVALFENVVTIISNNDEFYEKGRVNEFTDADIVSPNDDAITYFDETDKKMILEAFQLKPYMILYDYARRFVTITFLANGDDESYTFLFWTSSDEKAFDDYQAFLSQNYILNNMSEKCVMYYIKSMP